MLEYSRKEYKKRFNPTSTLTSTSLNISLVNNTIEGLNVHFDPVSD